LLMGYRIVSCVKQAANHSRNEVGTNGNWGSQSIH
jgi:hypothetical protein